MVVKKKKKGLGRGLGALIKDESLAQAQVSDVKDEGGVQTVPVDSISKNRMQPRKTFDEEELAEMVASIREHGVLQPLLVRPSGSGYELIAGERRLRAAGEAGLESVPVVVMDVDDGSAMELTLVENLQRSDLNIIEEAQGYEVLSERFHLTQEQIAARVGKSRPSVAHAMRVLALPDEIKGMIVSGDVSPGHAKVLTGVDIGQEQLLFARRIPKEGLSVRQLEKLVNKARKGARRPRASREDIPRTHLSHLSDKLHGHFGTSIRVTPCRTFANGKKGKGTIEIDYFSSDDLDRILEIIGIDGE